MDLKMDTEQRSRELEKQDKKERFLVIGGMGTDLLSGTQEDYSLKASSIFSTALDSSSVQNTSVQQAQTFNLISPTTQVTKTISPISKISPVVPRRPFQPRQPKQPDKIIGGFWFPDEKKKRKDDSVPYDAFVKVDATKKQKAKWVLVADNVPLVTSLSRGGSFVDENPSNRFRVEPAKGKLNRIVDVAWNQLSNKFREYSQKGGVKVGLRAGHYIEKRKHRIDSPQERRSIPQAGRVAIARKFERI
jgi:hypothetical protein